MVNLLSNPTGGVATSSKEYKRLLLRNKKEKKKTRLKSNNINFLAGSTLGIKTRRSSIIHSLRREGNQS